jgi:hypothetical protein
VTGAFASADNLNGNRLRAVLSSTVIAAVALYAAVVLAMSSSTAISVRLLATYALKGSQVPGLSVMTNAQVAALASRYTSGTYGSVPPPVVVVNYPGSLFPISTGGFFDPTANQSIAAGLTALRTDTAGDPAPVVFGYSQGAVVASQYKRSLNNQYGAETNAPASVPTYVLIGNPDRPNGGLYQRLPGLYIPFLDLTFDGATPTQSVGAAPGQITTYDIARQYDGFADFPSNPLNLIAVANAVAGVIYIHTGYQDVDTSDAVLQDRYGDTAYYLIPTDRLPLLQPLAQLGVPDPILAALDAPLRVLVEAGYDRAISPGQPTTAALLPAVNPLQVASNVVGAIPVGLDNGLQEVGEGRPFGTTPAGPYGVGGPPVTLAATEPSRLSVSRSEAAAQAGDTSVDDNLAVKPASPNSAALSTSAPPEDSSPTSERDEASMPRDRTLTLHTQRSSGTGIPGTLPDPSAAGRYRFSARHAIASSKPATPGWAASPTAPTKSPAATSMNHIPGPRQRVDHDSAG